MSRYDVKATALVEVVTEMYTRGPRISCSCQNRHVTATSNGGLIIFHEAERPGAPVITTVDAFARDNYDDQESCEIVGNLRNGFSVSLKGIGRRCITKLNPVQAWTLWELPRAQGILGLISIGGGKSLQGILAPLALNSKMAVLFIKADQRHHYRLNYMMARQHFRVPSIVFEDGGNNLRGSFLVSGAPLLHVAAYTTLSQKKNTQYLEDVKPDFIILDEAHGIANPTSARTKRLIRYLNHNNGTRVAAWSGSLVNKSLKDGATLALHALGANSPFPTNADNIAAWSAVIDPSVMPDTTSATARALYREFAKTNISDTQNIFYGAVAAKEVREAFRERLIHTPGVISTKTSAIACSITIKERPAPPIPVAVKDALMQVRGSWVRPDGEELVEALEQAKCAREVGSGFFYRFIYPNGEPIPLIDDWFEKRKAFNKALRVRLQNAGPYMDSPSLCEDAAARAFQNPRYEGEFPTWPEETWPEWFAVRDLVLPVTKAVWIDDFLARDAATWAREHTGIVWCQTRAFALKVSQLAGIEYHGGGQDAEAKILAEDGTRSIVASIKAHGEGRDSLQYKFDTQLIAEMPSSAKTFEQLLGRLCRIGHKSDEVMTYVYLHTSENRDALRKAIEYAEFIESTTPNLQLLLAADMEFDI
jgi:hypothetical protein